MKKAILIGMLAILSACNHNPTTPGDQPSAKYVKTDDPGTYIELNDNGTYYANIDQAFNNGTYETTKGGTHIIKDQLITFTNCFGYSAIGTITGETITVNGDVYIKK